MCNKAVKYILEHLESYPMKVTQDLINRLREAVEKCGGAVDLARKSGVDAANISRYLNGKVNSISDDNWAKLAPFLMGNASGGG